MEWWLVLSIVLGSLIVLMLLGVPVAFALLSINIVAVYLLMGGASGLNQLTLGIYESLATFTLSPIPLPRKSPVMPRAQATSWISTL